MYILLVGFPPFSGKTDQDILNKVQRGIYSIDCIVYIYIYIYKYYYSIAKDWKKVSKEAKELVSKMLTYDPTKRISAATALADVWFTTAGSKNTVGKDQQLDILGNMRQFRVIICIYIYIYIGRTKIATDSFELFCSSIIQ